MSSIDIEAKTTQEAVEKACKYFHLGEKELDIEVLESRSVGIFGLTGNKKVKIRATPKHNDYTSFAQETLERIVSSISPDTKILAEKKGDDIILNIKGNNPGVLIGPKGKTLEAMEFIINKAVNRISKKSVRVVVDAENYRQRREDFLTKLAFRMGEKAKKINKIVAIDPISPHDRRIIHLALKGDSQVRTQSKGEGFFKKVLIVPSNTDIDEEQNA